MGLANADWLNGLGRRGRPGVRCLHPHRHSAIYKFKLMMYSAKVFSVCTLIIIRYLSLCLSFTIDVRHEDIFYDFRPEGRNLLYNCIMLPEGIPFMEELFASREFGFRKEWAQHAELDAFQLEKVLQIVLPHKSLHPVFLPLDIVYRSDYLYKRLRKYFHIPETYHVDRLNFTKLGAQIEIVAVRAYEPLFERLKVDPALCADEGTVAAIRLLKFENSWEFGLWWREFDESNTGHFHIFDLLRCLSSGQDKSGNPFLSRFYTCKKFYQIGSRFSEQMVLFADRGEGTFQTLRESLKEELQPHGLSLGEQAHWMSRLVLAFALILSQRISTCMHYGKSLVEELLKSFFDLIAEYSGRLIPLMIIEAIITLVGEIVNKRGFQVRPPGNLWPALNYWADFFPELPMFFLDQAKNLNRLTFTIMAGEPFTSIPDGECNFDCITRWFSSFTKISSALRYRQELPSEISLKFKVGTTLKTSNLLSFLENLTDMFIEDSGLFNTDDNGHLMFRSFISPNSQVIISFARLLAMNILYRAQLGIPFDSITVFRIFNSEAIPVSLPLGKVKHMLRKLEISPFINIRHLIPDANKPLVKLNSTGIVNLGVQTNVRTLGKFCPKLVCAIPIFLIISFIIRFFFFLINNLL